MAPANGNLRRGLEPGQRGEVIDFARRGRGHPDVGVARAAVRWARRRQFIRDAVMFTVETVLVPAAGVAAVVAIPDPSWLVRGLVAVLTVLLGGVALWLHARIPELAPAVEAHNLGRLADADLARDDPRAIRPAGHPVPGQPSRVPGDGPAAPHTLRVYASRWLALPGAVRSGTLVAAFTFIVHLDATEVIAAILSGAAMGVLQAGLAMRRSARPVATIGYSGVELPGGIWVPWAVVADIRFDACPTHRGREASLVFELTSAAEAFSRIPLNRDQRRALAATWRGTDHPVIPLSCRGMRPGPVEVIRVARASLAAGRSAVARSAERLSRDPDRTAR